MVERMNASSVGTKRRRSVGKKAAGSLAVVILISLVAFLQPQLSDSVDSSQPTENTETRTDSDLRYGLLHEIRPDQYVSPQGLQYGPGSAEGHRLEHLRRHTKDQPQRPGKHGVFDGGMEGALATIDQAYERAKRKQQTTKQVDRDRTIYTVDLGRRVGYVGGREGNRLHRPKARRVKLVLDGTQFITAFPL